MFLGTDAFGTSALGTFRPRRSVFMPFPASGTYEGAEIVVGGGGRLVVPAPGGYEYTGEPPRALGGGSTSLETPEFNYGSGEIVLLGGGRHTSYGSHFLFGAGEVSARRVGAAAQISGAGFEYGGPDFRVAGGGRVTFTGGQFEYRGGGVTAFPAAIFRVAGRHFLYDGKPIWEIDDSGELIVPAPAEWNYGGSAPLAKGGGRVIIPAPDEWNYDGSVPDVLDILYPAAMGFTVG